MTSSCLSMWACKAGMSHNLPISLEAKIHRVISRAQMAESETSHLTDVTSPAHI